MSESKQRRVRVLYSFGPITETCSPYSRHLVDALGDSVDVRFFSWRTFLSPWPDVFHAHWPDAIVKNRRRSVAQLKAAIGLTFLLFRRVLGVRIVWTVHNVEPHETLAGLPRLFVNQLQKRADWRIYINESDQNNSERSTTILHGPLAVSSPERSQVNPEPRVMFFGMVRPYKGIEQLIAAFLELDLGFDLLIAGPPIESSYAETVASLTQDHANITPALDFIDDEELESLIRASRLVALPYTSIYNSGAVLLALELGSHVLATRTESTRRLQDEFGVDRLSLFDTPLGVEDLRAALDAAGRQPDHRPSFSHRDWRDAARAHVSVYESLWLTGSSSPVDQS